MTFELFSYSELTACALKTASRALRSHNFELFELMLDSVHFYKKQMQNWR